MNLFDEYSDMSVRQENERETSSLDRILEIEKKMIERYKNNYSFRRHSGEHILAYTDIKKTVLTEIKDILITPELLQEYIVARENVPQTKEEIIRGMYSAVLLEKICQKNKKEITLDAHNKTWNFLFYYAHKVKNISLKNCVGDWILGYAGSQKGSIENIFLEHIIGNTTMKRIGSYGGKADNITLCSSKGEYNLSFAGSTLGSAKNITVYDVQGNCLLLESGTEFGSIQNVVCSNIVGDAILVGAGFQSGHAKHITLLGNKGNRLLADGGSYSGELEYIIASDSFGEEILSCIGDKLGRASHIVTQNIEKDLDFQKSQNEKSETLSSILCEKDLTQKQKDILQKIKKISELLHTKSFTQRKRDHTKIAMLQEKMFEEEKT